MGYLDGSTITVDAILTKLGRRKLAEKGRLGIDQYTFGDTGIDYYLYNADHPSGSTSYGEAITRTPQLEANPDNTVAMRYTLTTMARNTVFIPKIELEDLTISDTLESSAKWLRPQTKKFSEKGENYTITIYGAEALIVDKQPDKRESAHVLDGGMAQPLIAGSGYPEIHTWSNVKELKLKARATRNKHNISYRVYGNESGQVNNGTITVEANM